ncbi:hypothetical protein HOY80DRAFT_1065947 [Tuber brumale]|nr:hypothetical protein HOY80DRAFT_1065947 [Tuber brumale]
MTVTTSTHLDTLGREFYTRGSHGKWYWPWGMPRVEVEDSLREQMVQEVFKEYLKQVRLPDLRGKTGSDSSAASASGVEHCPAGDDWACTQAAGGIAVKKFRGSFNKLLHAKLPHIQQ